MSNALIWFAEARAIQPIIRFRYFILALWACWLVWARRDFHDDSPEQRFKCLLSLLEVRAWTVSRNYLWRDQKATKIWTRFEHYEHDHLNIFMSIEKVPNSVHAIFLIFSFLLSQMHFIKWKWSFSIKIKFSRFVRPLARWNNFSEGHSRNHKISLLPRFPIKAETTQLRARKKPRRMGKFR